MSTTSNRREFLTRLGVGALAVGATAALSACGKSGGGGGDAPQCKDPTGGTDAQRKGVNYVDATPNAEKRCDNCALYQPGEGGCGKCTLFAGTAVAPGGYCDSWAKKA